MKHSGLGDPKIPPGSENRETDALRLAVRSIRFFQ